MKKIKNVFKRDFSKVKTVDNRYKSTLKNEVNNGCEWVLNGEGVATVKFDGTSCMIKEGELYKRYDCKRGRKKPEAGIPCDESPDEVTGHWPWWVPIDKHDKYHAEALSLALPNSLSNGTYELIGPKVQSNPYDLTHHRLVRHGDIEMDVPRTFQGMKVFLESGKFEGFVFHHKDGRMAKIRTNDFYPNKWNSTKKVRR